MKQKGRMTEEQFYDFINMMEKQAVNNGESTPNESIRRINKFMRMFNEEGEVYR